MANRTGEEQVWTTHQTALTVLPREDAPARGKRPRHFPHFVFFFFLQFFFSRRSRCCVVPAVALVISLRLLLTTKMVSMHVHFPSSRYFVAFVCVFCVILCVSVPCDKPLCGWSGLPCGWGYSYCGRGKSPRSCSGLPCGKGHAELCSTSDLQVHSDWVIGRLPFCLQNSSRPLFDEWGNAPSGRNNGSQSRLCTIYGLFGNNPCCCMEISALHVPVMCTFSGTDQHMNHL